MLAPTTPLGLSFVPSHLEPGLPGSPGRSFLIVLASLIRSQVMPPLPSYFSSSVPSESPFNLISWLFLTSLLEPCYPPLPLPRIVPSRPIVYHSCLALRFRTGTLPTQDRRARIGPCGSCPSFHSVRCLLALICCSFCPSALGAIPSCFSSIHRSSVF